MPTSEATKRNGVLADSPMVRPVSEALDAPFLHALGKVPLAQVDPSGEVVHINSVGRSVWGQLDGVRLPEDVLAILPAPGDGAGLTPLPVSVAGIRVLAAPASESGGWILVGYTEAGVVMEGSRSSDPVADNIALAIAQIGPDGVVTYVNESFEELTGRPRIRLLGQPFDLEILYSEDRHRFTAAVRSAERQPEAVARVRMRMPAGHLLRVEMRLRQDLATGTITAAFLDVTEHDEVAAALLQSEALYQTFLEQSPVGIVHLDREGVITFENHRLRMLTGEEADDAWIGRPLADIEGLDPRVGSLVMDILETGQTFGETDLEFQRSDGGRRAFAIHGAAIRHPEEGVVGAALMVFDVTSDRAREQELETRRRYDDAEPALRNAALSEPAEPAFLEEAARILGETAGADQVFVLLCAEDASVYEEEMRWARAPERSLVPVRFDGSSMPPSVEVHYVLNPDHSDRAAKNSLGTICRSIGAAEALALPFTLVDERGGLLLLSREDAPSPWTTPERQALAQLASLFETLWGWLRAEARYRDVVNTIEDSLFAFSFDEALQREYTFITRQVENLTGHSPADLLRKRVCWIDAIVHPEDRDAVRSFERQLLDGSEGRLMYRVRHQNGAVRWLRESASASRDPAGRLVIGGILSDVTDQKEVEASLLQAKQDAESANRMKSSFLATMSHELRTPLGAIKGFAELLQEEVAALDTPADEVTEFAEVIRLNASRVLQLVSDLLDLAKLQTERLLLERAPVAVHPLVQRMVSKYEPQFAGGPVTLRTALTEGEAIARADARRLEQVLDVLLSNAKKFTEEGSVLVATVLNADSITVSVEDSGIGMEEEFLQQVFEPFLQEDNRLNRAYEGSGLGLALAQRLVIAMAGTLAVESTRGEGSVFTVTLPRADV